jgi:hypothetical protein
MRKPQGHFSRNAEHQRSVPKPNSHASINRAQDKGIANNVQVVVAGYVGIGLKLLLWDT